MKRILGLALIGLAFVAGQAHAGSIALSEMGARGSGRGTTGVAAHDDASVLFYNPANLAKLEGLNWSVGASALMPSWGYRAAGSGVTEENDFSATLPPNLALSYGLGETPIGALTIGAGLSVPYGSSFDWGDTFSGRGQIKSVSLQIFEVAPVLALRPTEWFAVSAGFRVLPGTVQMKRAVQFGTEAEGLADIGGSGVGYGAEAGIAFWPTPRLSFGLAWRQGVTMTMTGRTDFDFPAPFEPNAVDREVKAKLPLAQTVRVGAAWQITDTLQLLTDVEWQGWSAFDALTFDFKNPDGTTTQSVSERNSRDTIVLHLGGEFQVSQSLMVRAGYVYDPHTVPEANVSPMPPDSDRHLLTLGASYNLMENVSLSAYFTDVFFSERTTETNGMPGDWTGTFPGGSMGYLFGLSASGKLDL